MPQFVHEMSQSDLAFWCVALTVGANHTLPSAFWAEFYGTRYIGAVKAMAAAVMVLGTAIGPILTGVLIDRGVTFDTQMIGIAGWFACACAVTALAMARAVTALPYPRLR